MPYTHDNRWSPGASRAELPEDSPAMYSARWIDQGDDVPADVLPDRQGFAYSDVLDRGRLMDAMIAAGDALRTPYKTHLNYDVTTVVMNTPEWKMYQRRAGGYIYVDAWLVGS
jgi:hypothetical protein